MNKNFLKGLVLAIGLLGLATMTAQKAQALSLTLDDGLNAPLTFLEGLPGMTPPVGGVYGDWTFLVAGTSDPLLGSSTAPHSVEAQET